MNTKQNACATDMNNLTTSCCRYSSIRRTKRLWNLWHYYGGLILKCICNQNKKIADISASAKQ